MYLWSTNLCTFWFNNLLPFISWFSESSVVRTISWGTYSAGIQKIYASIEQNICFHCTKYMLPLHEIYAFIARNICFHCTKYMLPLHKIYAPIAQNICFHCTKYILPLHKIRLHKHCSAILIMKANEMGYFSNLFDKVLYMFRTGSLSIIRSILMMDSGPVRNM